MLIGVSGKARHGKDTVTNILVHHGIVSRRYAFSDPLKRVCNALFGWNDEHSNGVFKEVTIATPMKTLTENESEFCHLLDETGISSFGYNSIDILAIFLHYLKDYIVNDMGIIVISPRRVYQLFGTEVCRNNIHPDIWIELAPKTDVVISDVRFHNEAGCLRKNDATLVRVERDTAITVEKHDSEKFITTLDVDHVIKNDGSLYDLETKVMQVFDIPEDSQRLYGKYTDVKDLDSKQLADIIAREFIHQNIVKDSKNTESYKVGFNDCACVITQFIRNNLKW